MLSNKMVATRRGTRVGSPARQTENEITDPTPTTRRTRSRTVIVTNQPQSEHTSDSQQEHNTSEPANPSKRETRRSKRHPTTANQADCIHEADVSESESCCSVSSDVLVQSTPRSRRRTANRERPTAAAEQEVSEGKTCTSAPASKPYRSTRNQKKPALDQENDHSEEESCSSIASLSIVAETQMITRSRRRVAVLPEDANPSEADSCSSAVSPLQSIVRRSTRSRRTRPNEAIPIHLEDNESAEASASSASTRAKARKTKEKSSDEGQAYDSDGCCSGPSSSPQRKPGGVTVFDSDSDLTCISLDSPCSLRVRLTPCSSRTGSANSISAVPTSRTRSKVKVTQDVSNVLSVASKGEKLESKGNGLEKDQTETPMDMTFHSVSEAVSDSEDIEEVDEVINRTVISVDSAECDVTLTPEKDDVSHPSVEAKMLESQSGQEMSSVRSDSVFENTVNIGENHSTEEQVETKKGVTIMEESEKSLGLGMEKEAEFMQEDHGKDDQTGATEIKPGSDLHVTEENVPNFMEDHNTEDQKLSDSVGPRSVHVVDESEEKVDMPDFMEDHNTEDQKLSNSVGPVSVNVVDESEKKVETVESMALVAGTVAENLKPLELDEKGVRVTGDAGEFEVDKVILAQKGSPSQAISVTYNDLANQKVEDEQVMEVEEHQDMDADHHESLADQKVEDEQGMEVGESEQHIKVQEVGTPEMVEEGPSSSSKAQTKPQNLQLSLLDSSEDEESDDDRLSDEGCKEDAANSDEMRCLVENQPWSSEEPNSAPNNGLFVIDTRPGHQPSEEYYIDTTGQREEEKVNDSKAIEDEEEFIDEEDDDDEDEDSKLLFPTRKPALRTLSSAIDPGLKVKELGGLYINFDGSKSKTVSNNLQKLKAQKNQDELLKKSVIVADFEKKDAVPLYKESKHAAKLKRKEERAKTTGDGWFNMKAPELTEEVKNDLKTLKMRSAMDPKRFYKKNDREGFPKYFQVGTVVDNPADFYHARIPKKQRKKTIVDELLADAEFRSFNKRKYQEIMLEKSAEAAGKKNKKHKIHKMK